MTFCHHSQESSRILKFFQIDSLDENEVMFCGQTSSCIRTYALKTSMKP